MMLGKGLFAVLGGGGGLGGGGALVALCHGVEGFSMLDVFLGVGHRYGMIVLVVRHQKNGVMMFRA